MQTVPAGGGASARRAALADERLEAGGAGPEPAPRAVERQRRDAPVGNLRCTSARWDPSSSCVPPVASRSTSTCIAGLWPTTITESTSSATRVARSSTRPGEAAYRSSSISVSPPRPIPSSVSRVRRALEHRISAGRSRSGRKCSASTLTARRPRGASGRSWSSSPDRPSSTSRGAGRTAAWCPPCNRILARGPVPSAACGPRLGSRGASDPRFAPVCKH